MTFLKQMIDNEKERSETMRILALDSSGLVASVAVVEEEQTIAEYTVNYKKTHSQTLLPMLDEIVKMTEMNLGEIDAIAVAGGPGSFTGLRIGSATAKGLGLALKKPLIHIPTVDGLAYNLYGNEGVICPIMDARRNQVYTGIYRFREEFVVEEPQMAIEISALAEKLNERGEQVTFLGDGVPVYKEQLEQLLHVPVRFAPSHLNRQRAAAVGTLAVQYWKEGKIERAEDHQPDYLRMSQAERERLEREEKEQQGK
ncbi:tRNA (adenosine(37)-N6)-threonylcarbamoyltransferase complex dimerization subunit type 1 TsaB [Lachnospiraceae bacterium AM25-17]|nr:tRNA (adenosine(37)-N6)-threonylcarbamoyltransferase complex dimerization subunit type 1 TsaB [Lachnospiraceae bacterium AM25-17]RJU65583.1 tRNA (adenosine(37)-N6)-threonylcarbamoyltransferase complex dimerization subunit type 1 TsaB [Coprococcus sp. AM27-12LB]